MATWLVTPTIRPGSRSASRIPLSSASAWNTVSPSTVHTYRYRAKLTPQLSASALPPFSLSITSSRGWVRLR